MGSLTYMVPCAHCGVSRPATGEEICRLAYFFCTACFEITPVTREWVLRVLQDRACNSVRR
jgi:hypothetical protein